MFKHAVDALAHAPGGLDPLTLATYGTPVRELCIQRRISLLGIVRVPYLSRAPKRTTLACERRSKTDVTIVFHGPAHKRFCSSLASLTCTHGGE